MQQSCSRPHTHNVDDKVGELARKVGGEVVSSRLDEKNLGLELLLELFERSEVGRDVPTE